MGVLGDTTFAACGYLHSENMTTRSMTHTYVISSSFWLNKEEWGYLAAPDEVDVDI